MVQVVVVVDLVGDFLSSLQQPYQLVPLRLPVDFEHDLVLGEVTEVFEYWMVGEVYQLPLFEVEYFDAQKILSE